MFIHGVKSPKPQKNASHVLVCLKSQNVCFVLEPTAIKTTVPWIHPTECPTTPLVQKEIQGERNSYVLFFCNLPFAVFLRVNNTIFFPLFFSAVRTHYIILFLVSVVFLLLGGGCILKRILTGKKWVANCLQKSFCFLWDIISPLDVIVSYHNKLVPQTQKRWNQPNVLCRNVIHCFTYCLIEIGRKVPVISILSQTSMEKTKS